MLATAWMNLKCIKLNGESKLKKQCFHLYDILKKQTIGTDYTSSYYRLGMRVCRKE